MIFDLKRNFVIHIVCLWIEPKDILKLDSASSDKIHRETSSGCFLISLIGQSSKKKLCLEKLQSCTLKKSKSITMPNEEDSGLCSLFKHSHQRFPVMWRDILSFRKILGFKSVVMKNVTWDITFDFIQNLTRLNAATMTTLTIWGVVHLTVPQLDFVVSRCKLLRDLSVTCFMRAQDPLKDLVRGILTGQCLNCGENTLKRLHMTTKDDSLGLIGGDHFIHLLKLLPELTDLDADCIAVTKHTLQRAFSVLTKLKRSIRLYRMVFVPDEDVTVVY